MLAVMGAVISVVDDDESFRRALSNLLNSVGYSVAAFGSAEEFLESGRIDETACVISDVQMPGMSGFELQEALRRGGHELPIIFVAAYPGEKARDQALTSGALAFLGKPFSDETLMSLLEGVGCGDAR